MANVTASKTVWVPPPRPEWLTQLNAIGENCGSPATIVDLRDDSLISAATNSCGLDDFGTDDCWRDGFSLLVKDLDDTARLSLAGRVIVRAEIIRSLRARLQIAEAYARHPDIAEQRVQQPVFITGMGRSGTTLLHELFAEDPQFRVPLTWELLYPCPPPETSSRTTDPRIAKADLDHTFWAKLTPEYLTMHENRGDSPGECVLGTMHEFASQVWSFAQDVPDYDMWLRFSKEASSNAYKFHRHLLRILQFRAPGRWMLKAPTHLASLGPLFSEYPDAHVIVAHRDPLKTLPSLASLIATMRRQRSDHVDYGKIVTIVSTGYPILLDVMMRMRDGGSLADRFIDVRYSDLIRDPIATMRSLYDRLSVVFSDETARRMTAYLENRPKDRHGAHQYSLAEMGLDPGDLRAAFADYQNHFNVDNEI